MEATLEDNAVLKTLQNLFKENCPKDQDTMSKLSVIKLFFDYKIIDSCGYNIFEIKLKNFIYLRIPYPSYSSLCCTLCPTTYICSFFSP